MPPFPQLDQPPAQPPGVTGQMGSTAQVGLMLGNRFRQAAAPQPGGPPSELGGGIHPSGALMAQADAVKKVLRQMARQSESFAPFAERAVAAIEAGLGDAIAEGRPTAAAPVPAATPTGLQYSARPSEGEAGRGFPG